MGIKHLWALLTASGVLCVSYYKHNAGLRFATYATLRKSVIGVALESASAGALCRVGTKGTYALTTAQPLGGAFDQRTATIPGTRGTIAGSSAVLFGMG